MQGLSLTRHGVYQRHTRKGTQAMTDISKDLPEAAKRALAEAEARRKEQGDLELPTELGGRTGPEPVRYGDWERKGIAVDF
jgi:hypothetical protein